MDRLDAPLACLVEPPPIGVFALDSDGRVVLWNSATERLTGWSRDRVLGDEAFALLDVLWATVPVGLAFFDTDLRYRRVNGAVLEMDGGTVEERLGRTVEEVHGVDLALGVGDVVGHGLPAAATTLLLYTDGLVERRRDPQDRAGADLLDLVRAAAGLPLAAFCDHVVRGTGADTGDDVVVLAVRLA